MVVTCIGQSGFHNIQCQLPSGLRAWTCIRHLPFTYKSIAIPQGHFEGVGPSGSTGAHCLHSVCTHLHEMHLRKIGHHIGLKVLRWVLYFIKQLFCASLHGDTTTVICQFGNEHITVGADLCQGIAQASQVRHIFVTRVGKIASRNLGRTLQQMSHHHPFAQQRPIIGTPLKMVHEGR